MVNIDEPQLKALMRLKPSLADTAAFFECSESTIHRFIQDTFNLKFKEFRDRHMVHTRHDLVRKAIAMAMDSNVPMLIFCLKNLCAWKDRPDPFDDEKEEGKQPIVLSEDQLQALVRAARGKA